MTMKVYDADNLPEDEDYCDNCLQPCKGIVVDNGIGEYEYWGQKGFDSSPEYVSDCCEAAVMRNGREVEMPERDYDGDC
jgi:hypothetical protein